MKINNKLLNKEIINNQTTTPTETITSKVKPIGIITPNLPLIITGLTDNTANFAHTTTSSGKTAKTSTVTKTVHRSFSPTSSGLTTETSNSLNISISNHDKTILITSAAIFGFATFAIFFWWICRRTQPGTPLTPLFPLTPVTPTTPMTPSTQLRWNLRNSNEPRKREKTE